MHAGDLAQTFESAGPPKTNILGVRISRTSYTEVAEVCRNWISDSTDREPQDQASRGPAHYICVTSVHGIITAVRDRRFRSIVNKADIATPDGMPVVWALRSFGAYRQSRVYGPILMSTLCEQAQVLGHRVFLYGGRAETLRRLRGRLLETFPKLKICGAYSPPFRPLTQVEERECRKMLQESEPHIVFVGLSTPKQERWMADHYRHLPGTILVGVGAAFDFHAGTLRQAPKWMQHAGLEWCFRLLMEPGRLWRRYALVVPLFLFLWPLQKLGLLRLSDCIQHESAGCGS